MPPQTPNRAGAGAHASSPQMLPSQQARCEQHPGQVYLKGMMAALNFAQSVTNETRNRSSGSDEGQEPPPPPEIRTNNFEKLILATLVVIMQELRTLNDQLALAPTTSPSEVPDHEPYERSSRDRSRSPRRR